jgi:ion channel
MGGELHTAASSIEAATSGERLREPRPLGEPGTKRYALLLATIVASFAVQGIARPAAWEQLLVTCLLGATLILALWVVGARPVVFRVALAIVAATVAVGIAEAAAGVVDGRAVRATNGLLVALAPPAIIVGVVRSLRATQAVTLEAVFGVLCVYLLLGMLYAFLYGALDHGAEGSFFAGGESATVSNCLYFSFTTLSTVGYGDFTAHTNLGHTLSVSEALFGQIYLVTIVSLIVANLGRRRDPSAAARRAP